MGVVHSTPINIFIMQQNNTSQLTDPFQLQNIHSITINHFWTISSSHYKIYNESYALPAQPANQEVPILKLYNQLRIPIRHQKYCHTINIKFYHIFLIPNHRQSLHFHFQYLNEVLKMLSTVLPSILITGIRLSQTAA